MRRPAAVSVVAVVLAGVGCAGREAAPWPRALVPQDVGAIIRPARTTPQQPCDLTKPGEVARGVCDAEIIDTGRFPVQVQESVAGAQGEVRVREILPPHGGVGELRAGPPNGLVAGVTLDEHRASVGATWPSIGPTGWVPPDPCLAVGPNHVVVVVNQSIGFFTRAGAQQFLAPMNSTGNPGFFETVGASTFVFDPKCFYDHYAGRFVVVAPEVYDGTDEAYICIAVSDDSDPNGVWYKYRTDAVVTVGSTTYWWDYPGFGYDAQAWYVTSNLFGLNASGFGGAGYRVFDKAAMLSGGTASYATLRDGSAASVQIAQHFGTPIAPFFVSVNNSSSLKVQAIRNPLTSPTISTTTVSVPSFSGPGSATTPGGSTNLVDWRIMNVCWRGGTLHAAHNISTGGKNVARWYQLNTNSWPTSGTVTLAQSGNADPGPNLHSFFPAIYSNAAGEVGMVLGVSGSTTNVSVAVTGRRASDPAGRTGVPEMLKIGEAPGGGRWGDYYDIAIDPVDDTTFWVIGEYQRSGGWANWVGSFTVGDDPLIHAVPDDAGVVLAGGQRTVDVLANDWHGESQAMTIQSFQATSLRGGTVVRSVGTGPGGRDQLRYTAPSGVNGADSFTYTITDASSRTSVAAVSAMVLDPATFRNPDGPGSTLPGVDVAYYALTSPSVLPNFAVLDAYAQDVVGNINYASTSGNFATSGRADNLGAVFDGYVSIAAADYYTFSVESDDGSKLYVGDTLLINNDGLHGMAEVTGSIGLNPGLHRVRVEFFEAGSGAGCIVRLGGSSSSRVVIPASQWFRRACEPDVNQDGIADQDDVLYLTNVVAGGPNPSGTNPDFDGNGIADQDDVTALINVIAGGACP